jgi:hypothetical protein
MSAENVQIIHGMYQAFARGDVQAVIAASCSAGCSWNSVMASFECKNGNREICIRSGRSFPPAGPMGDRPRQRLPLSAHGRLVFLSMTGSEDKRGGHDGQLLLRSCKRTPCAAENVRVVDGISRGSADGSGQDGLPLRWTCAHPAGKPGAWAAGRPSYPWQGLATSCSTRA